MLWHDIDVSSMYNWEPFASLNQQPSIVRLMLWLGTNVITVISGFPTKSHEMRGRMIDIKLHDGVDVACK